jgi:pyruvate dehydrogenase E2 component (dihydrolipoamide acetyltransferase)
MLEVIMPKMGDAMEEGTLLEWLKNEGDQVKSGETIGNIQTDKATVELTAPSTGTLAGFLIKPGDTVPVGVRIAAVLKAGETLPGDWKNGGSSDPKSVPEPVAQPVVAAAEAATSAPTISAPPPSVPRPSAADDRIAASPLARRLAQDAGISLAGIAGTGPKGRIVERDVRAALTSPQPKGGAAPSKAVSEDRLVPLNNLKKITAARTLESTQTIPHYYVTIDVDVERLSTLREAMNEESPDAKLSLNDFIIRAAALALAEQPHINASFEANQLRIHGSINIGIAAAVPDGLTMPVLHRCQDLTLREIAGRVRDLVGRARDNKLSLDELTGSTFAISNMGMFDIENFAAIINQPNGAILAVSSARKAPVVVDGDDGEDELEIRRMMKITASFDHRIIDGAVGAQFMGVLRKYLESPTLLLS